MTALRPGVIERLRSSLITHGILGTATHYVLIISGFLTRLTPTERERARKQRHDDEEFARKRAAVDTEFDATYGVDTAGKDDLIGHSIVGPNKHVGNFYMGVFPSVFYPAVESLGIAPPEWTFIDIGAGKGRAVLMAQMLGFKQSIGVEFSRNLATVCENNLKDFAHRHPDLPPAEVHCMDALQYELPAGPLLLFLANPFGADLMTVMAGRINQALVSERRPLRIIYYNAVCDDLIASTINGLRRLARTGNLVTYGWDPPNDNAY